MASVRRLSHLVLSILLGGQMFVAAGQNTGQDVQAPGDESPVQLSVTLVQIDAVVTDGKGNRVPDLAAEDFEILEDGKPQAITYCGYFADGVARRAPSEPALPGTQRRITPEDVSRTIAIVVDEMAYTPESETPLPAAATRKALNRFVDEEMQPGDLVAIVEATRGAGALQQFTSDKTRLRASIDRIHTKLVNHCQDYSTARESEFGGEVSIRGSLATIDFMLQGLRDLPGRKALIYVMNGGCGDLQGQFSRVRNTLRRLSDLANRGSVTIYAVDVQGLQTFTSTAAEQFADVPGRGEPSGQTSRRSQALAAQDVAYHLAEQTGGFFFGNNNDIAAGIRRAAGDLNGYYLLAYVPADDTFQRDAKSRAFHKLEVRVKRPGLKVRSRRGFYGTSDAASPVPKTREEKLARAVVSPFAASDIDMRLTPFHRLSEKGSPFLQCLVHIDAAGLTFTDDAHGSGFRTANLEIVLVAFDANGQAVEHRALSHTVRLAGSALDHVVREGFVQTFDFPIAKPGDYQIRAVVRDAPTGRLGSSYYFVNVPDIGKDRLAMSGIAVLDGDRAQSVTVPRVERGGQLRFGFDVYNAKFARATKEANVQMALRLWRDGQTLFEGPSRPVTAARSGKSKRFWIESGMAIGERFEPGIYTLEVTLRDPAASEKQATAKQYLEFEIR